MNKLMFVAAGVAVAGSAFATPTVYDYKASVKHLYLQPKSVKVDKVTYKIYTKIQKSSTLKGYLVMDSEGVTSPTIMKDTYTSKYSQPSTGYDYGRNRGFLVVQNNGAWSGVRTPKIIPAVLDAKWIDTAFTKNHTATSGLAEGTLYAGGDAVMPVRPQLDKLKDGKVYERKDDQGEAIIPLVPYVDNTPENFTGMIAAADYVWTSIYLFAGSNQKNAYFNGPNWFRQNETTSPFGAFEYAWDQNLPTLLQTGWKVVSAEVIDPEYPDSTITKEIGYAKSPINYFHDTWLNGAGIGKWVKGTSSSDTSYCCGLGKKTVKGSDYLELDSLSGNLKGGLFLCTENGIDADDTENYNWFDDVAWEDQFVATRIADGKFCVPGTVLTGASDAWQNDLWQDGFMEQETTDVIYGTWSIKRNTKLLATGSKDALTYAGVRNLYYITYDDPTAEEPTVVTDLSETYYTSGLINALYSAAYKLNKNVNFADGSEIYAYAGQPQKQGDLPMITPQFAAFYRLVYDLVD